MELSPYQFYSGDRKRRIDYVDTKDMSQKSLHLQKIVSQPFSANLEPHTTIANPNIQKWHVYHHGCQGRKLQRKKVIFTRRKID